MMPAHIPNGQGIIVAAFSALAIILGIICSLKLSQKFGNWLIEKGWINAGWAQIISFVLLPLYFKGDLYTAYEMIEKRFGSELRTVTSGLFLLTRAAAEGVRVNAVSIVVSIA